MIKKSTAKLNCWEVKRCGREPEGKRVDLGVCPSSLETRLNSINAGRACWVVAGTLCGSKVQGTFARKYATCEQCDFFNLVRQEEGADYISSLFLICKLK